MRTRIGLGAALLAVPLLGLAADSLDVKLGLWEVSIVTDAQGISMPKGVLDKLPPDRRAKFMAEMKKNEGRRTTVDKSCVTAEDIRQGAFRAEEDKDPACKTKITAQTRTLQEATVVCTGEEPRTSHIKIQATDREHITGTVDNTTEHGKLHVQMSGKWIGASCAGVDD
jgi:hypothetical protein